MAAPSYGTKSISTVAAVLAANPNRKGCIIYNNGAAILYVGFDASVTSSNGLPLLPQSSLEQAGLQQGYRGAIYGIAASGTVDVRYMEWDQ